MYMKQLVRLGEIARLGALAWGLAAGGVASADGGPWLEDALALPPPSLGAVEEDAGLFADLIPGEPLTDQELSHYYGKGVATINVGGDGVVNFSGDFTSNNNNNFNLTDISGIAQIVPVIGDNNIVNLGIEITINVNTVTIQDSNGSDIAVNQVLDFNGVFSGPFSR